MNTEQTWNQIAGHWRQFAGEVQATWGKLTDDDCDLIAGRRDQLIGKLRERYGWSQERAATQVDDFARRVSARRGRGQAIAAR